MHARTRRLGRFLSLGVALAFGVGLVGCGGQSSGPGIESRDGYVAHPTFYKDTDGCGGHGNAKSASDPYLDYLKQLPRQPVVAQICTDGWVSNAVGVRGSCSSHGGVDGLRFKDGTEERFRPGGVTIIDPDGTVRDIDLPN